MWHWCAFERLKMVYPVANGKEWSYFAESKSYSLELKDIFQNDKFMECVVIKATLYGAGIPEIASEMF